MNSDSLMIVQLAAIALLASALLVAWGDLGGLAFVRRLSGGVKFVVGLVAMAGMVGVLVAPNFVSTDRRESKGAPLDLDWPLISLADGKEVNLSSVAAAIEFFVMLIFLHIERCECRRGTTPRRSEAVNRLTSGSSCARASALHRSRLCVRASKPRDHWPGA